MPSRKPSNREYSRAKQAVGDYLWFSGIHVVEAMLVCAPARIKRLCFSQQRTDKTLSALRRLAESKGVPFEEVEARDIERLAGERHQGVAALSTPPPTLSEADLLAMCERSGATASQPAERDKTSPSEAPLFLILDRVSDPHNFGACARSAEACGVTAVVVPDDHSSALTPIVARASAGAAVRVPIARVSNLARCMRRMGDAGVWMAGLSASASSSLYDFDCRRPLAFVLGCEGRGMRRLTREQCDYHLFIPMSGAIESLNLSAAAAICLFESRRQRSA